MLQFEGRTVVFGDVKNIGLCVLLLGLIMFSGLKDGTALVNLRHKIKFFLDL